LEQTILHEISTLPEAHQMDVLTFVRFLKVNLPDQEKQEANSKKHSRMPD